MCEALRVLAETRLYVELGFPGLCAYADASPSPRAQVVYQRCPDCSKARMGTRDGFVEVEGEELERYEGSAEHLVIDGPTPPRLDNEVAVCSTCHALIHAGLLRIIGQAQGGLRWLPVAADRSLARAVESDCAQAARLPVVQFAAEPTAAASANADSAAVKNMAKDHGLDRGALAHGLIRLGVPATQSRRTINAAIQATPPGQATEESVLRRALAML